MNVMNNNFFKGLITAIITPFDEDKIDFDAFAKIIHYQISHEVDAIVVAGSTGEGISLSEKEYKELLANAIEISQNKIPIIAGIVGINMHSIVDTINYAQNIGVHGLMCCITPYLKPTQDGIYRYFEDIHEISRVPIMLYSVPARTSVDFSDDTLIALSRLPRIKAFKDAGKDIERPLRIVQEIPVGFNLLSGDDEYAIAYNAHGGVGCVSVASNIAPKLCKLLQKYCYQNDYKSALEIQTMLMPLYKALFAESNPIPVKYAASKIGLCSSKIRMPLLEASITTKNKIDHVLENLKECI